MGSLIREIQENKDKAYDLLNYTDVRTLFKRLQKHTEDFYRDVTFIDDYSLNVLLDIVTLFTQNYEWLNANQEYEPKSFQIIRDYNGEKKVIAMPNPPFIQKGTKRDTKTFKQYDRKLFNSISRSNQTARELILCNDWKYFVSLISQKNY